MQRFDKVLWALAGVTLIGASWPMIQSVRDSTVSRGPEIRVFTAGEAEGEVSAMADGPNGTILLLSTHGIESLNPETKQVSKLWGRGVTDLTWRASRGDIHLAQSGYKSVVVTAQGTELSRHTPGKNAFEYEISENGLYYGLLYTDGTYEVLTTADSKVIASGYGGDGGLRVCDDGSIFLQRDGGVLMKDSRTVFRGNLDRLQGEYDITPDGKYLVSGSKRQLLVTDLTNNSTAKQEELRWINEVSVGRDVALVVEDQANPFGLARMEKGRLVSVADSRKSHELKWGGGIPQNAVFSQDGKAMLITFSTSYSLFDSETGEGIGFFTRGPADKWEESWYSAQLITDEWLAVALGNGFKIYRRPGV